MWGASKSPTDARGHLCQFGIHLEVCVWPCLAFILVTLPWKGMLTFPKLLLTNGPLLTATDFDATSTVSQGLAL